MLQKRHSTDLGSFIHPLFDFLSILDSTYPKTNVFKLKNGTSNFSILSC